jgi:hypothetical protein
MNKLLQVRSSAVARAFAWYLAIFLAGVACPVSATTIIPPSFDQLVQQADYIVHAKVKSVNAEWRIDGANKHIITKVELDVSEVIAGTPPESVVLVLLGGKIGDKELRVDGSPHFAVGDEDILFVRGNGQQFTPLVAMEYGRYRVMHDAATGRDHVARDNGAPLYSEQDTAVPMADVTGSKAGQAGALPLTPEDFKSRIRLHRQNDTSQIR